MDTCHDCVPSLVSMSDLEAAHKGTATAVLVRLHKEGCPNCPAFGVAVGELAAHYQFDQYECDAAHEDCDLLEPFQIKQLPALLLRQRGDSGEWVVRAGCSLDELRAVVKMKCTPVLTLDAEF